MTLEGERETTFPGIICANKRSLRVVVRDRLPDLGGRGRDGRRVFRETPVVASVVTGVLFGGASIGRSAALRVAAGPEKARKRCQEDY